MSSGTNAVHNHLFQIADSISAAAVVAVLTGALPAIAALGAILWYACMLYDWVQQKRAYGWRVTPAGVSHDRNTDH